MTASAVSVPRALTAYLRHATWDLPEPRRQELWDELEEHVLTRADHLTLSGLSPTQAMAQAIRELGPPARVTLGMAKVYIMPKLLLAAGTLALGLSAGLYALAGGGGLPTVILPVISRGLPKEFCVFQSVPPPTSGVTIVSQSKQDGSTCYVFKTSPDPVLSVHSEGTYVSASTLTRAVQAMGGTGSLDREGFYHYSISPHNRGSFRAVTIRDDERYFPTSALVFMLMQSDVRLSGFDQPVVTAKTFRLKLGESTQDHVGADFYSGLTQIFAGNLATSNETLTDLDPKPYLHTIRTTQPSGEVLMLMTQRGGITEADYAPVSAGGIVRLRSISPHLTFIRDPRGLRTPPRDGAINAVLYRVTNTPITHLPNPLMDQATSDAP